MTTELGTIDRETGAPAQVRAVVGGISKPADRLATLRKFYGAAFPDPEDDDNFLFLNPKTGRLTSYNPAGLDFGDVASMAREGTQAMGSIAGATAGAPLGIAGIAGGSVLGAAAGEELFQLVMRGMDMPDTRSTAERVGETAMAGVLGLGGPAGSAAQAGGAAAVKGAIRRGGAASVQQTIEDAARFGFDPSLAVATKNHTIDAMETFASRSPGGFSVMQRAVNKTLSSVKRSVDDIVTDLAQGNVDSVKAGRAVKTGIEDAGGFVERFNTRAGQLYDSIRIDGPVSVENTIAKFNEILQPIEGAEQTSKALANKQLEGLFEAFQADVGEFGTIPFEALKRLRTAVGQRLSNTTLIDDVPKAQWKQIYGALSEDIKAAAKAAGPEQSRAFSRANQFWKAGTDRIENFLDPLVRKKTFEDVSRAIELGAKAGPTKVRSIRRSLKPEQWRVVVGNYLTDMTKPRAGQLVEESTGFSFEGFLTKWNGLEDATKDAMFGNMGELRKSLDTLVRLSQSVRESGQAFANPSGTAGSLVGQTMMFGSAGSIGAGLATGSVEAALLFPAISAFGAMSINGMSRLFTNPTFVKWLAASSRIKPNGMGAHIGRLAQIGASGDLATKQAVLEYSDILFGGLGSAGGEEEAD